MASATTLHESEVGANESFGAFRFNLSTSSNLNDGAEGTPAIPEFVDPSPPPPTGTDSWFKWMTKLVFRHQGKIAVLETRIAALNTQAAVDRAKLPLTVQKLPRLKPKLPLFKPNVLLTDFNLKQRFFEWRARYSSCRITARAALQGRVCGLEKNRFE
ncbi:hypothetical protein BDR26DRAFT_925085 [Obelidium mucronatum]|nr:hypothetical protein BDR26DRAFT_925085 [Obelidium mucronatum]